MINVKTFQVNPLMVNCYVVSDDTLETCIIDCGCMTESEWDSIKQYISDHRLNIKHLLCTHLHFDHIMGSGYVYRDFHLNIEGSLLDLQQYNQLNMYMNAFGLDGSGIPTPPPVNDISQLDSLTFGTHTFRILKTPGHSPGGLCFYCKDEDLLFSGDTLFQGSVGRTDLPGGDPDVIVSSIRNQLFVLPSTTHVFTGHGPSTTIEYEQHYNPYIFD